jgi:hypothetical protein
MAVQDGERSTTPKNPDAVALGRRGGLRGGVARARNLTPAQRTAAARHAALSRWGQMTAPPNLSSGDPAERFVNAVQRVVRLWRRSDDRSHSEAEAVEALDEILEEALPELDRAMLAFEKR